jgi:hypothetical protein
VSSSEPVSESPQHLDDNARVFGFETDGEDEAKIETVLAKSRKLLQLHPGRHVWAN